MTHPVKRAPFSDADVTRAVEQFPTPFYLYDEAEIRRRLQTLAAAFAWNPGFRQYFAVKALPNPAILDIVRSEGGGADCASPTEIMMAQQAGLTGDHLMFSSNNTPAEEFVAARDAGAIINLDSLNLVDYLAETAGVPETICCRYSPAYEIGSANNIMGEAGESKFGMTREQIFTAFERLRDLGAKRFGIHCMAASNSRVQEYWKLLATEVFELAVEIKDRLGIEVQFLNFGGGIGIAYRPGETEIDVIAAGGDVEDVYRQILEPAGLAPAIYTELGRYITGPAGALITRVLHRKSSYKEYVGVDASAVNLLRPAMYGSYHHLSVVGKAEEPETETYDVVGSLCENNDKFAIDRALPEVVEGDIIVIHDAGAHGFSMGYNYNGKLRSAEYLLEDDGNLRMIRRAETPEDYFATLRF